MSAVLERSDESFHAIAKLELVERRPVTVEMTAEEIVEFEEEYVLGSQKVDATRDTPAVVILLIQGMETVRAPTYRKAIALAKALLDAENE